MSRRDLLAGFTRSDEELGRDIRDGVLPSRLGVAPGSVSVAVDGGVVTLTGRVDRRSDIAIVKHVVSAVDGVVRVEAELGYGYDDDRVAPSREGRVQLVMILQTSTAASAASRIRILVCDDNALVRRGVRRLLEAERDFDVVAEASDRQTAVAAVGQSAPDVVVMDIRMPGASGIEACREIRARFPATAVVMLTSFDDGESWTASIAAGASGYLLKQIRGDGLVAGVREAAAGRSLLDS